MSSKQQQQQQQQQQSMHNAIAYEASLLSTNTTFVQADPSNFRAIVQHLTGSQPPQGGGGDPQTTSFKLHERRQQHGHGFRKLEMIKLNNDNNQNIRSHHNNNDDYHHGPMNGLVRPRGGNELAMVSPVSTLDAQGLRIGSPSPRSGPRRSMSEEEERVIAQKGFYLHPLSPLSGANSRDCEPQLLPLFPLHSPRNNGQD